MHNYLFIWCELLGRLDKFVTLCELLICLLWFHCAIGPTAVKVRVTGLTPGLHGFHLVSACILIILCFLA